MLNQNNYFGIEASKEYFSVSQFKDFMQCEASALAAIKGEYKRPMSRAMLVGSFVDTYFEGTLQEFMQEHPEILTQKKELKAEYKKANDIIDRLNTDTLFMKFMSGEKQKIITFEMFGVKWKMKMDSFIPNTCITDLKIVANFKSLPLWRYDIQGAVYQKGVEIALNQTLPFYLAVATKEQTIDFDIFQIPQTTLDLALNEVESLIGRFNDVKREITPPKVCGVCGYCKSVKKASIRNYNELLEGSNKVIDTDSFINDYIG